MSETKTGYAMWQDHKAHYGMIRARVICNRYLAMQENSESPEEQTFCRELREAMLMKRNYRDSSVYDSAVNQRCADDIADAIRACEYGDGSHELEPAVQALIDHYGTERLSAVLAACPINAQAAVLDELNACLRDTVDRTRATESPELNESERNFAAWLAVTQSSRFRWVEDDIYRLNGHGAMYYTGGEDGIYMRIRKDGTLEAGNYEGAIPHIGEAFFKPVVTRQLDSFNDAFTEAMKAGGRQFLVDMFSGTDHQPLVHMVGQEEKPSVLKQLRDAKNDQPHKPKAPGRHKNNDGFDR